MEKKRVDVLLVEKGLAETRSKAAALVMAGQVTANGNKVEKAGMSYASDTVFELIGQQRYVSRGGEKLAGALAAFDFDVSGKVCVDVGSSTGGFTDCLLQAGAAKIYCIDVGKGILHWKLRSDKRVVVMEETNARHVQKLPEHTGLVVCDASFISLKVLLPVFSGWLDADGTIITLIKPQFEAGRVDVAKGKGVVRDAAIHRRVLRNIAQFALEQGFTIRGLVRSTLLGPKGNVEFLLWLDRSGAGIDIEPAINQILGDEPADQ